MESYVEFRNVHKNFGEFKASNDINFSINKGRLVGLLGPSGSGKTTILRMIAGLESPDKGDIFIKGKRVNDIMPGKRGIGFVFQNYALFRYMTVFENIAFGLRVQKVSNKEIAERVKELITLIGLNGFEQRYPNQLSGGQRQRVAFARALAPKPEILLLDEPFAAIDAKVRKELRQWLKATISQLGITSVFVTHDQDEAVEVADDIIITNKGRVEQMGTPLEIYKTPKTPFVVRFIGESNVIEDYTILKGYSFDTTKNSRSAILRPEFVEIAANEDEILTPLAAEHGIVRSVFFRGSNIQINVEVKGEIITGYRNLEKTPVNVGDEVLVLIHRLYSFYENKAFVVENSIKSAVESPAI